MAMKQGSNEFPGQLRPMDKAEVAEVAGFTTNYFWRLAHDNEELMKKLEAAGYKRTQKVLTVRQVKIVLEEFGFIEG